MPACLNAANEELVAGFLANKVRFVDIPRHIETVMGRHDCRSRAQASKDVAWRPTDGPARRRASLIAA